MIATDPHVSLLGNRRVEKPAPILTDQLRECSRIAIFLTKCMRLFVLGLEMEDVNAEANVVEVWVCLDMLSKQTIVIEKNVIRLDCLHPEGMLDEFLR